MPRIARVKGEFSTYHIISRGNEKKDIFLDSQDKKRFLEILQKTKRKYNFKIYAYCLLDNHLHLIIYDNGNDISLIMKSINISYVMYFNRKHERVGHLFQDRFKSQVVADDTYLLELSKYIHNNPVKAGIVKDPIEYKWSSFKQYVDGNFRDKDDLLSTSKILGILSSKETAAQKQYHDYVTNPQEENTEFFLREDTISLEEENRSYIFTINEAKGKIQECAKERGLTVEELIRDKKIRNDTIRRLRKNTSLKLKDIGELLGGLSESQVSKILKG